MFFNFGYDEYEVDALRESSRLDGEVQGMDIGIKMGREEGKRIGREEGRRSGIEIGYKEGMIQGFGQGRHDAKIEIAKKLIHLGLSPETIATTTELSREEIANIQD